MVTLYPDDKSFLKSDCFYSTHSLELVKDAAIALEKHPEVDRISQIVIQELSSNSQCRFEDCFSEEPPKSVIYARSKKQGSKKWVTENPKTSTS